MLEMDIRCGELEPIAGRLWCQGKCRRWLGSPNQGVAVTGGGTESRVFLQERLAIFAIADKEYVPLKFKEGKWASVDIADPFYPNRRISSELEAGQVDPLSGDIVSKRNGIDGIHAISQRNAAVVLRDHRVADGQGHVMQCAELPCLIDLVGAPIAVLVDIALQWKEVRIRSLALIRSGDREACGRVTHVHKVPRGLQFYRGE